MICRFFPLVLLIVSSISYAIFAPWLGYYRDDWPGVLVLNSQDLQGMIDYQKADRPLFGLAWWYSFLLLGSKPFAWHVYAMVTKWIGSVCLWWLLKMVWPRRLQECAFIALLVLIYPGMQQEPLAFTYSIYWLQLAVAILSYVLMVWAYRHGNRRVLVTFFALSCEGFNLFLSQYFFGLELIRPLVIFFIIGQETKGFRKRLLKTFQVWIPYLIVLGAYLVWYLSIFNTTRDEVDPNFFLQMIKANPVEELGRRLGFVFPDIVQTSLLVWPQMLSSDFLDLSSKSSWLAWTVAGVTAVSINYMLKGLGITANQEPAALGTSAEKNWGGTVVAAGIISIGLGMVPMWLSGMNYEMTGANTRYGLPAIVGGCLITVGLISLFITRIRNQIIVVSTLVGLAVGVHIKIGNEFRHQWKDQKEIVWQLSWRIPELKPNTLIWLHDEGWQFTRWPMASDHNLDLTAPVNLMYTPDNQSAFLRYWVSPLEEDFEKTISNMRVGETLVRRTRNHHFSGLLGNNLVVWYDPPSCVYVLSKNMEENFPLPPLLTVAKSWSDTELITSATLKATKPPLPIFGSEPPHSWCHYFQKAELERQFGNWEKVAELGREVIARNLTPNNKGEWHPFIEAYRKLGLFDEAERLIKEKTK